MSETEIASDLAGVKHGNFKNYYQFASVENRINLLPTSIWKKKDVYHALDVGCNTGELTEALYQFITSQVAQQCCILGVDLDPMLIHRANKRCSSEAINFLNIDFMKEEERSRISEYMKEKSIKKFDVVFCFSTTMWIHLNYGDEGLNDFLRNLVKISDTVVIEPQPWHCYRAAKRRIWRTAKATFSLYQTIKMRNPEEAIMTFLARECNYQITTHTARTEWNRRIMVFENKSDQRYLPNCA